MEVDLFKEIIVPVIGGLGIFLLGLEFMASGIQALSVNKMRECSSSDTWSYWLLAFVFGSQSGG